MSPTCDRCGRSDGTFETYGTTVTHWPCEPDTDAWSTPLGRWRLATVEWLRARRAPPEALSVEQRPSGDDPAPVEAPPAETTTPTPEPLP